MHLLLYLKVEKCIAMLFIKIFFLYFWLKLYYFYNTKVTNYEALRFQLMTHEYFFINYPSSLPFKMLAVV